MKIYFIGIGGIGISSIARYYLKKAGFPNGENLPEIILTTTSDYLDLCEFIQFELANFGIQIKIEVATGGTFRNNVANSNLMFFINIF